MKTQRNSQHDKFIKPKDYKDLGWQIHIGNSEARKICHEAGHELDEYNNSLFMYRGTEYIYTCHECKMIWHIDMSD